MPIKLRVDNDCELTPSDLWMLTDMREKLRKDHTRLFDYAANPYSTSMLPLDMLSAIDDVQKQREKITTTEFMVRLAILLVEDKTVSTISDLARFLQHEVNYGNTHRNYTVKTKAKAAQDIINLLQPH